MAGSGYAYTSLQGGEGGEEKVDSATTEKEHVLLSVFLFNGDLNAQDFFSGNCQEK